MIETSIFKKGTSLESEAERPTYTNPVYEPYFADPMVFSHEGTYYAVGTGPRPAGATTGEFSLLRSNNLVDWEPLGMALKTPPEFEGGTFWAPEVAVSNGKFYLYYSVGTGDKAHQLRVAIADSPEGPYVDHCRLSPTTCPFSIDASPYRHTDGEWYLFYATDFLDGERPGTALVVDRLIDMIRLAGEPQVVARATSDWQRYQSNRPMYDGVYDWHTLEGPFPVLHDGMVYCIYSGGNWQNESYGVDFVVADHPLGPYKNEAPENPRILKTKPGQVIGPGHNSVALGPNGRTEYIVYHAWDAEQTARQMRIDPIQWADLGPICDGPSLTKTTLK